jgi:hypothetical protein
MIAIRLFLVASLLALAAAFAYSARAAMPLRGPLAGAAQEAAVRSAPVQGLAGMAASAAR